MITLIEKLPDRDELGKPRDDRDLPVILAGATEAILPDGRRLVLWAWRSGYLWLSGVGRFNFERRQCLKKLGLTEAAFRASCAEALPAFQLESFLTPNPDEMRSNPNDWGVFVQHFRTLRACQVEEAGKKYYAIKEEPVPGKRDSRILNASGAGYFQDEPPADWNPTPEDELAALLLSGSAPSPDGTLIPLEMREVSDGDPVKLYIAGNPSYWPAFARRAREVLNSKT